MKKTIFINKKKLALLFIMSVKTYGGGGLNALMDMSAKNVSFFRIKGQKVKLFGSTILSCFVH